jgi:8-oxo-dGTP pyrophosphatase MutT (NUDIX family)
MGNHGIGSVLSATLCVETEVQVVMLLPKGEISRGKSPLWRIPGGKVEDDDETPEDAVIREVEEETGLHAVDKNHIKFLTTIPWNSHNQNTYLAFIFDRQGLKESHQEEGKNTVFDVHLIPRAEVEQVIRGNHCSKLRGYGILKHHAAALRSAFNLYDEIVRT